MRHKARSASSDPRSASERQGTPTAPFPTRLGLFWRRKPTVTPATLRSLVVTEQHASGNSLQHDPNDSIVFLNTPIEFDLRSYFFKKPKSSTTTEGLERSAISQRSTSSRRSQTNVLTSMDTSYIGDQPFRTSAVMSPSNESTQQTKKPRRRLRASEELCIVLPRSTSRGRTRSQKSWFLGPGFIGRDPAEGTFAATKDKSMDAVHAEISVAGDDYFVRDTQSTTGTFLCLNTRYRHYPQRDGFRLRSGDIFRIGPATSIRVEELRTSMNHTPIRRIKSRSSSTSSLEQLGLLNPEVNTTPKLERTPSTSGGTSKPVLKPMSTVEKLRLLAADMEDELVHNADRHHSIPRINSLERKPQQNVHFSDTPPVMSDGSIFLGSRYLRSEVKELHYHEPSQVEDADDDMIQKLVGSDHDPSPTEYTSSRPKTRKPASLRLVIFQHDPAKASTEPLQPQDSREVILPGQESYLIGSSAACDVRIFPSEGIEIRAVHARIVFDGVFFVLQDVSFERDPRRQTRVLLAQRPVKITRGDWLLLGKCALYVTTVVRAFGSERRPDMKEAAMRLDVLRLSKRKPRTKGLFVPVGFRLQSASGSGASSGSSGWGGSSGGPVTFGKGRDCDAQVFTASLATEQFSVQLERGTCLLTPRSTGINAGTYFLIGRDEIGPPLEIDALNDTEEPRGIEIVKHGSKPLLLSEGCVFRCGGSEIEVICVKNSNGRGSLEQQEHTRFLSAMPWLKPIATDLKTIAVVARCGQRLKLNMGDVVYEKGDAANFVFIVVRGDVDLLENEHADESHDSERVSVGGFFGEESLHDPLEPSSSTPHTDDLEYTNTAKAASACELLALAREDVCGYLDLYLDIIRAHLKQDRCRDRIIRAACGCIPWLQDISLQEMRLLSAHAEITVYPPGSTLFEDGKLFVPAAFAGGNTFQLRDGLLVLRRGDARVVRSKHERQHRRNMKIYHANFEEEHRDLESVDDEPDEWWGPMEPVIAMSSSLSASVVNFNDLSFRVEACSTVECFFIAAVHLEHLTASKQEQTASYGPEAAAVAQIPSPLKRGNSHVGRRLHHSEVITSALHSDSNTCEDEDYNSMDGSDGEGDSTGARRWRRKKRNKHLLEETVLETQNDAQIPNALVLYVLAGAQRGDIHVVRNVASIGGLLSGADIELNDRYVSHTHAIIEYHDSKYWLYDNGSKWGSFVRLEEDNAVDINPGDVFLAGEVEFTCLAAYPERNKPSLCCLM
ncbi:hypothetical protein V7S43_000593 [Phytophthora oleae]|uniref:FHA domain-containing protein n=1 Tax=Phytophthora oleae TaxID=2107226 RepID=A0ABD3G667_9STRA